MKFGKKIQAAAAACVELCDPNCWLNYKHLKKELKNLTGQHPQHPQKVEAVTLTSRSASGGTLKRQRSADQAAALAGGNIQALPGERRFFTTLKIELNKVADVYSKLERQAMAASLAVVLPIRQLATVNDFQVQPPDVERLLKLHKHLLLLRNYAVLNYTGFTKILKKHDKVTGFQTRDKYLMRKVQEQPFTEHNLLQRVLAYMQGELNSIRARGQMMKKGDFSLFAAMQEVAKPIQEEKIKAVKSANATSEGDNSIAVNFAESESTGCFSPIKRQRFDSINTLDSYSERMGEDGETGASHLSYHEQQ